MTQNGHSTSMSSTHTNHVCVGVFNRSKLTRLVIDSDWDKKVFHSNWKESENKVEHEILDDDKETLEKDAKRQTMKQIQKEGRRGRLSQK